MTGSSEFHDALFHLPRARQFLQRTNSDGDIEHRDIAAAPHDAGIDAIACGPMDDDFVDQATEERFFAGGGHQRPLPQLRQMLPEISEGRAQFVAHRITRSCGVLPILIESRLGR